MRLHFLQILVFHRNCDVRRKSNFVFVFFLVVIFHSIRMLIMWADINLLLNHICGIHCNTTNNDIYSSTACILPPHSSCYSIKYEWQTIYFIVKSMNHEICWLFLYQNIFSVEWKVLNKIKCSYVSEFVYGIFNFTPNEYCVYVYVYYLYSK